jgi:hypothetical protein
MWEGERMNQSEFDGTDFFLMSPAELYEQGCIEMLDGNAPVGVADWEKMINFWAYRLKSGLEIELVCLVCMIYQPPVSIRRTLEIVKFQQAVKELEDKIEAARYN